MRKYYQAALVVIAIVSLLSLLFYRHEYNKLRYVLEVFNYFGKPNQKSVETNCTDNKAIFMKYDMGFDEPLSSWQRLHNNLYVYSAYNVHKGEVQVIGFASLSSIKDIQCEIFFQDEVKSVLGHFRYFSIDSNIDAKHIDEDYNYKGYHFYCAYMNNKIPIAVRFFTKSDTNLSDIPILPIKQPPHSLNNTNVGICVTPSLTNPIQLLQMVGFVNFHNIIGIDNFIVYDFGIPIALNSILKEMSTSQNLYGKFTYVPVPWNFPFPGTHSNIIKDLIEADCLYRTYNRVMYVSALSWEEYIVLKYHHTLVDLLEDFKKSRMKGNRYKLETLTFCMQQTNSATITNVTYTAFNKLRFDPSIIDKRPVYIYNSHEILNKQNIYTRDFGIHLVLLNRYKHCSEKLNLDTTMEDKSILRFTEDIQNSDMYRKFIAGKKFL